MDLVPFNKSVLKGTLALSVRLFLVEWGTLQDTVPCCHRPLGHDRILASSHIPGPATIAMLQPMQGQDFWRDPQAILNARPKLRGGECTARHG